MVIILEDGIRCTNDKKSLYNLGLSEDYIYFEHYDYSMYIKLHKDEIKKFISYRPKCISRDARFFYSYSNNITDEELSIIIDYLNINHIKRKYKTVSELVTSKTRLVNKKKMLIEDYSVDELAEFIENKRKGETVCQS